MAEPNLVNVTSIYGRSFAYTLQTSLNSLVNCNVGKLIKINTMMINNDQSSQTYYSSVALYIGGSTYWWICYYLAIPPRSTTTIIGKDNPIYLANQGNANSNGDKISAQCSTSNVCDITISYEIMDDA